MYNFTFAFGDFATPFVNGLAIPLCGPPKLVLVAGLQM